MLNKFECFKRYSVDRSAHVRELVSAASSQDQPFHWKIVFNCGLRDCAREEEDIDGSIEVCIEIY